MQRVDAEYKMALLRIAFAWIYKYYSPEAIFLLPSSSTGISCSCWCRIFSVQQDYRCVSELPKVGVFQLHQMLMSALVQTESGMCRPVSDHWSFQCLCIYTGRRIACLCVCLSLVSVKRSWISICLCLGCGDGVSEDKEFWPPVFPLPHHRKHGEAQEDD